MVWQSIRYLGLIVNTLVTDCINDTLIDNDDMARQRKQICSGQCIGTDILCVRKPLECPCSSHIAPPCTRWRYGVITDLNRCENFVNNVFFFFLEKYLSA